jgi:hypothetical protein
MIKEKTKAKGKAYKEIKFVKEDKKRKTSKSAK